MKSTQMKAGLAVILFLSVAMTGCQKMRLGDHKHGPHAEEPTQYVTIDKTLSYGEVYTLDLTPYEDKDDLSAITQQATTFTTSALSGLASTSDNKYTYSLDALHKTTVSTPPDTTATSTLQQVVLTVTEGQHASGGCFGGSSHNNNAGKIEAVITINFTIK